MIAAFESHLGRCLAGQMRFEEAEAIMRPALGRILEACDWTHRSVLPTLIALIDVYEALGRTDRAAQHRLLLAGALNRLHQTASIANAEKAFGPEYQALWSAMRDFDRAVAAGSDSAPEQLQRVFSLRRQSLPDDHDLSALFADVMCPLLNKFWGRRGFDAHSSLAAFRELLTIARASPHLHPYKRASAAYWVSYNLEMTGDHQEGEAIAREALLLLRDRRDKSFGRGGPVSSLLGRHLVGQARYEEAEPWLVEGYELLLQAPGPQDWNTWVAWERLVQLYTTWGQNSERLTPRLQHLLDSKPAVAPNLLDVWAWHVLIHPNLERSVYATALDAIRRADRLVPDNVHFIKTLGMAHYRVGDYETALSHMRRADELRQAQLPGGIPEDVAFIAMSLFQLGRADEARAAHARMSALLADDRPDHRVAPQLGAEADRLLAAPANR
jgi:tetratricopeptide (TPR) repeat protein